MDSKSANAGYWTLWKGGIIEMQPPFGMTSGGCILPGGGENTPELVGHTIFEERQEWARAGL